MNPARLETLADGVFAIAATLLILSVDGQVGGEGIDLGASLAHAWPSYVAYAVSFVTIGIMWINHHTLMAQIGSVDRRFLVATIGLLMCIAFVPFPTRLVAEHVRDSSASRDAALAYGFTMTTTAIFFCIVWFYASRGGRLLRADADLRVVPGALAQLPARAVDLPRGDADRVRQLHGERRPLPGDRRASTCSRARCSAGEPCPD